MSEAARRRVPETRLLLWRGVYSAAAASYLHRIRAAAYAGEPINSIREPLFGADNLESHQYLGENNLPVLLNRASIWGKVFGIILSPANFWGEGMLMMVLNLGEAVWPWSFILWVLGGRIAAGRLPVVSWGLLPVSW